MLRYLHGFILILLFSFFSHGLIASSGHVIVHIPDLSEKQIDSVSVWFAPQNNIEHSGLCLENKLLLIGLVEMNSESLTEIYSLIKSKGFSNFFVKEPAPLDVFYKSCSSFIVFH